MRILFVSEYWKPRVMGGGEISGGLLAESLAAKGVDVSVLTSRFPGLAAYETLNGVKVYRRLTTGGNPQSPLSNLKRALLFSRSVARELPTLCREQDYDIIHSLNVTSLAGVSKARAKIKKPCVAHINSPTPFCPRGLLLKGDKECLEDACDYPSFKRCVAEYGSLSRMNLPFYLRSNPLFTFPAYRNYWIKKKALGGFDHYMPISSFVKRRLMKEGIKEGSVTVIPNIVEIERFLSRPPESNQVPRILYLGQYSEYKGPQVLLKALCGLEAPYECSFYGSGPLRDEMIEYIKKNRLSARIFDEVPQGRVHELYASHDIIVFPSLVAEAFGRVAVESMASGKPVIASAVGGVTDIVEDGITGFLYPPGNVEALSHALQKLVSDGSLRREFGRRAQKVATERYSAEAVTKKVLDVYRKILAVRAEKTRG